jgi:hypothetical protein
VPDPALTPHKTQQTLQMRCKKGRRQSDCHAAEGEPDEKGRKQRPCNARAEQPHEHRIATSQLEL